MKSAEELAEIVACLKNISLFKELADDQKAMLDIAALFSTVSFKQGGDVVEESVFGDTMYIIKTGTVEIVKKTRQGEPYVVAELTSDMHAFFGEVALIDPDNRSATVRCKTDCELYSLERKDFVSYGDAHPIHGLIITREISRILCKRLRKSNADILTLFDALVEEVEKAGGIE